VTQQADAAAEHLQGLQEAGAGGAGRPRAGPARAPEARRRSGRPSRTSSTSRATKGTSPSASTRRDTGRALPRDGEEGSTISGFRDAFAQAISYALQYGCPCKVLADKFSHMRFEPSGMTEEPAGTLRQVHRGLRVPLLATKSSPPTRSTGMGVNVAETAPATGRGGAAEAGRAARGNGGQASASVRDVHRAEPGIRAAVQRVRSIMGPQRQLLQVRQLRQHEPGARREAGSQKPEAPTVASIQ